MTGSSATGSIGLVGHDHVDLVLLALAVVRRTARIDLDVDALPRVGPVVGGHRRPLVGVLEPARAELEVALALVTAAVVHHDRLHGQRYHDVGVGDLVDAPGRGLGDERELGPLRGLVLGLLGSQHHVPHAEVLELGHPHRRVVVDVAQATDGVRRLIGHRGHSEEVVRRRAGGLEEQALHGTDAPVGPERQQHERHRGAVVRVVLVVLPHRAAAPVVGVVADALHRRHGLLVLGVVRAAPLVALEVVAGPPARDRLGVVLGGHDRPPRVDRGVAFLVHLVRAARQHLVHEAEDEQHREPAGRGKCRARPRAGLGLTASVEREVPEHREQLDGAHHHQEVPGEVEERQDPGVPEQADHRQAVASDVDGEPQARSP